MRVVGILSLFAFGVANVLTSNAASATSVQLARYPDISGDRITFVYADRIWLASSSGGTATMLADFGSGQSRPKFSPDGSRIAFTANVDGNFDIYVVPVSGGVPVRVTHHPARDYVVDWDPSGTNILFASTMSSSRAVYNRLHLVSASGGLPETLPLPYGETATFSEDGTQLIFTYLRDFQEEAWKRYYGGRAPDLWSYDLASGATARLTDHPTSDSMPMQIGGQTYFLSERDENGRSNIWRIDSVTGEQQSVTQFVDTDVRRPSTDGQQIIFEIAGGLRLFDPALGTDRPINLDVARANAAWRPVHIEVGENIENASLGDDNRVIIEARGDVFVYDTNDDIAINLTQSSGSAERFPQLSANGSVAYFSDRNGEYQLFVQSSSPDYEARQLTDFSTGFRYNPYWSPDGRKVAFFDHEQILWVVDIASGRRTRVDQGLWRYHWDLGSLGVSWSPDSRWLAYSRGVDNRNQAIFVHDVTTGNRHQLTSGTFSDFSPIFDPTGNYLLMLSNRNFEPVEGDLSIDATWTYADSVSVNILPLIRNVSIPGSPGWEAPAERARVTIDLADSEGRLAPLEAAPGSIDGLAAIEGGFAILRSAPGPGGTNKLERYEFGSEEPHEIQEAGGLRLLDARGQRLLTRAQNNIYVIDLSADGAPEALQTNRLAAVVDRREEYRQVFNDTWRYARDFYYDAGLHGVDWDLQRQRYGTLVPEVTTDDDMTYVLLELLGELEGGHVYATGGPRGPRGDARNVGLLGIDFEAAGNAYRIGRIHRTGNRRFEHRSPLDNAALDVREGNYILSVNGRPLTTATDPWAAFEGLADQVVDLRIADNAAGSNARTIQVETLASERKVRELAWVEDNRRYVEQASGGRIGYIYVPNTSREGQNELMIQYRSQFNRDALLIDERFNTGGALGDRLVELLNRPPLVYFRARNSTDYPLPEISHRGPKALLINGWSYSGGDGFPLLFKTAEVGPLIGTRTWGGLIGPGMQFSLINGGAIAIPPIRVGGLDGTWSEGNEGVHPDIEILNDPGQLARGVDQQLERGIAELMQDLTGFEPVPAPTYPRAGDWNPENRGN